jgi:ATP-dependent DNA ligase
VKLLEAAGGQQLEGIGSKRKDSPYRSGALSGWIKVKTPEWKVANKYRAKLFDKS